MMVCFSKKHMAKQLPPPEDQKNVGGVIHPELLHRPPPREGSVIYSWQIIYPGGNRVDEFDQLPEHVRRARRDQYRG